MSLLRTYTMIFDLYDARENIADPENRAWIEQINTAISRNQTVVFTCDDHDKLEKLYEEVFAK